jgi:hypothetical protein
LEAITGNPVSDTAYYISVDVDGAFDPITQQSTQLLSDVTAVLLLDQTGNVISRLRTFELESRRQYAVLSLLPRTGFRVALEGKDTANNVIRRSDEYVVSSVVVKLDISVETADAGGSGGGGGGQVLKLSPGQSGRASVNVTNVGMAVTWYIRVSDTGDFYAGVNPIAVTLSRGGSSVRSLPFRCPSNVTPGYVSTATVSAATASGSVLGNYQIFYINVVPLPAK